MNTMSYKAHLVFRIDGEAIGVATVEMDSPVALTYVMAYREPTHKQITNAEKETLLEFGCVEELELYDLEFQYDGVTHYAGKCWNITKMESPMPSDVRTVYKIAVEA